MGCVMAVKILLANDFESQAAARPKKIAADSTNNRSSKAKKMTAHYLI
jgi:hypothetical protein